MLEVQQRVMTLKTAQELANLVGNHCAETPFQVPARYDDHRPRVVPGYRACAPDSSKQMPRSRSNA
jgi:hypothetical protein